MDKLEKSDFGYFDAEPSLGIPAELSIIKRGHGAKEIADYILENQEKALMFDNFLKSHDTNDSFELSNRLNNYKEKAEKWDYYCKTIKLAEEPTSIERVDFKKVHENQRLRELVEELDINRHIEKLKDMESRVWDDSDGYAMIEFENIYKDLEKLQSLLDKAKGEKE